MGTMVNFFMILTIVILASMIASLAPIQDRYPAPNGSQAMQWRPFLLSGKNLVNEKQIIIRNKVEDNLVDND